MTTILIAENAEKIKDIVSQILARSGNINIGIIKEGNVLKIAEQEDIKEMVSLKDKIVELGEALCREKRGRLYKSILEVIEKPLFEYILEYAEGNQLKAARILGLNRNTIRAKIKKLGINCRIYKQ